MQKFSPLFLLLFLLFIVVYGDSQSIDPTFFDFSEEKSISENQGQPLVKYFAAQT